MGKSKKIKSRLLFMMLCAVMVIICADLILRLKDQYRIPHTNCYLRFEEKTMVVNLVYKRTPLEIGYKTILDHNILEVYWNKDRDILAVCYKKDKRIVGYFLLTSAEDQKPTSAFEPYLVQFFSTKSSVERFLKEHAIDFVPTNHYFWNKYY